MFDWLKDLLHYISADGIREMLLQWGVKVVAVIVFVETGLLIGFFLPGDSLLVTAGLFAADPRNGLDIWTMLVVLSVAAVLGDGLGFWIGSRAGPALFRREDARLFKRKHLMKAHSFYEKYGGKTIVLARFIPIIRTFAPTVAGAAGMNYRRFVIYNIAGGVGWVSSMLLAGFGLGHTLGEEALRRYLHLIIGTVIFLSILPGLIEIWRARRERPEHGERAATESRNRTATEPRPSPRPNQMTEPKPNPIPYGDG